ncbi:MAG: GldG family protein [Oscillospiraceae bacterium]|nr:GldG family protein [Oscillospiraceae bacterium]
MKKLKKPDFSKTAARFRSRTFRVGGYSMAAAALVLAIAVAANMLVSALPASWTQHDITQNGYFSISDQTEQVLEGLDTDVTIYWVVRDGNEDSALGLLLEKYEGYSDHVKIQKKDPDLYPAFVEQYTDEVEDNSLIVESDRRSTYVSYYDIYEYDYSSYYYTGTYNVSFAGESSLTSAIYYVTGQELPVLYALTGHGESELSADFSTAVEKENITMETLNLLTEEDVPDDCDCLMILLPQSDLTAAELPVIREYLKNGGDLLLITDPQEESGSRPNLDALMADYGVSETEGILVEGSDSYYAFQTPYYLLPDLKSHTITSPLMSDGYYILMPIAHGLTIDEELPETLSVTSLLETSGHAFSKVAGYSLSTYEAEEGDIEGPFQLGVAITDTIDDGLESNLIWFSSGGLVDDSANEQVAGGNQDLFLNALDWLCGQTASISIHAKSLDFEYLTMDSGTASGLTLLFVGLIPVACLVTGAIITYRRRHK